MSLPLATNHHDQASSSTPPPQAQLEMHQQQLPAQDPPPLPQQQPQEPDHQISHPDYNHAPENVLVQMQEMYNAAKGGDVNYFTSITKLDYLTHGRNSVLHIAALFKQHKVVREVLKKPGDLFLHSNSDGDTPLHIAARSGDLDMVKLFIDPSCRNGNNNVEGDCDFLFKTNSYGNTALHEALMFNRSKVALELLKKEPKLAGRSNSLGESPLYLSVQMGILEVARYILHPIPVRDVDGSGPNGQTPLHAAAMFWGTLNCWKASEQKRIASLLYEFLSAGKSQEDDQFGRIRQKDLFGRTALHYAASNPASQQLSRSLLKKDPMLAYIRDKDGHTPLLTAVRLKNWTIFNIILDYCPDCAELCYSDGQNVLHQIIEYKLNPSEILEHSECIRELINKKDRNGNTPLHLAVKHVFTEGITSLLQYRGAHLRARNNENHTALDLVEKWPDPDTLKTHYMQELLLQGATRNGEGLGSDLLVNNKPPLKELKELAGNLLVVCTLISTISFTAAFTLPGGYSQDEGDEGLAVLGKKVAFQAFLISDAVAVWSSMACGYVLIRGLIGYNFLRSAMKQAVGFLTVSLFATMVVFSTGIYVVTEKKSKWPAIFILTVSCFLPIFLRLAGHHILTKLPFQRKTIDQPEHEVANRVQNPKISEKMIELLIHQLLAQAQSSNIQQKQGPTGSKPGPLTITSV